MSLEIIRRKEGEISQKQEIRHEKTQVSYNDFGHLCIREFGEPHMQRICVREESPDECPGSCMDCNKTELQGSEEHLIVFDTKTSRQIIDFVAKLFGNGNGLPF